MTHAPSSTHAHLDPRLLGLVFLGGTVGTALRAAVGLVVPPIAGVPWATVAINALGAFALGLLLAALVRHPDHGRGPTLRLLLGTGLLGGFTTYSALAVDTAGLLGQGRVLEGVAYGLGTLVAGLLGAWSGLLLGTARRG
ncbi:MAG: fluoride exporter [Microbacteriaceae bacterium]|nr:fluoride exporter [Microbacteriaceae bacterium]